jgi:site-specific DNA-methyltransferase (adenine-specific)/modification methylase
MKPYKRKEVIGDAVLYLGDCLQIMPTLGKVDAVVTDPPYGIGENNKKNLSRKNIATPKDYGNFEWDEKPADQKSIKFIQQISNYQIIFGGNYFHLPPTSCWLVWDKKTSGDFADCELAWTNLNKAVRKIEWLWNGMIRKGNDIREHPTQKPEGVMRWCINHLPDNTETILDPFMGSGTTGVACANLGRKFIGIELEPKYFDIACKRIDQAQRQGKLFTPPKPKPEQGRLL